VIAKRRLSVHQLYQTIVHIHTYTFTSLHSHRPRHLFDANNNAEYYTEAVVVRGLCFEKAVLIAEPYLQIAEQPTDEKIEKKNKYVD